MIAIPRAARRAPCRIVRIRAAANARAIDDRIGIRFMHAVSSRCGEPDEPLPSAGIERQTMERKTERLASLERKAPRYAALVAALLAATLAGCATTSSMNSDTLAGPTSVDYYQGA
jgi:hypothetical protein